MPIIKRKNTTRPEIEENSDVLERVKSVMGSFRGERGDKGQDGIDGKNGKDSTPTEVATRLMSDGDFLYMVKGDKGDPGVDGEDGIEGKDGLDGRDGLDGKDGIDGSNGISPDIEEIIERLRKKKLLKPDDIDGLYDLLNRRIPAQMIGAPRIKVFSQGVEQPSPLGSLNITGGTLTANPGTQDYTIAITGGGGGSGNIFVEGEVASGSGSSFTVSGTPVTGTAMVYALGQRLYPTVDYTISGSTVTITNGDLYAAGDIVVDYATALSTTIVPNEVLAGSGTSWTLSRSPIASTVQVYGRGQRLYLGTDYSIAGSVLTTLSTWSAGDLLADYQVYAFVANEFVPGSGTSWTLTLAPKTGSQQLYARGQRLTPTVDYSISGQSITTVDSWSANDLLSDYQLI